MKIVVTTTAMPRPEILENTYASWTKNLKGIDWKQTELFLTIDPLPDKNTIIEKDKCFRIAKKYFGKVHLRESKQADFNGAVAWCWESVPEDTDFILHLEDDWELHAELDISEFLELFKNEKVQQVCFRAYHKNMGTFNLGPSLIRYEHALKALGGLGNWDNPEEAIRKHLGIDKEAHIRHPSQPVIRDTGTKWRDEKKYVRSANSSTWTSWLTKEEADRMPPSIFSDERIDWTKNTR